MEGRQPDDPEEFQFWQNIASRGYSVSLDGARCNPIAGRWQRELDKKDANGVTLRSKYEAVSGANRKRQFRA
eukprot:4182518-Pyramimonas_sp.AAC.1